MHPLFLFIHLTNITINNHQQPRIHHGCLNPPAFKISFTPSSKTSNISLELPLSSSAPGSSPRDSSTLNPPLPVTAHSQSTWLPQTQTSVRPLPPTYQDFQLFGIPSPALQYSHQQRAHLLASRQPRTSNLTSPNAILASYLHHLQKQQRQRIPPVPLFHQPSTTQSSPLQNADDMVSMEPNVAYEGTLADLGIGGGPFLSGHADMALFDDDMFSSIQPSAPASSTISPKDLMMDIMGSSVPGSALIPELTPCSDMLTTPGTSPWFHDNLIAESDSFAFSPLFPPESGVDDTEDFYASAPAMSRNDSLQSQVMVCSGKQTRKGSMESASSPALGPKLSASAGIRKRQKPLPAIVVDSDDPVALKRARNTAAARKSRERKEAHRDALETRIAELEAALQASQAVVKAQTEEITLLKASASVSATTPAAIAESYDLADLEPLAAFNAS